MQEPEVPAFYFICLGVPPPLATDEGQWPGGECLTSFSFCTCPLYFTWVFLSYLMPSHFIGIFSLGPSISLFFLRVPRPPWQQTRVSKGSVLQVACFGVPRSSSSAWLQKALLSSVFGIMLPKTPASSPQQVFMIARWQHSNFICAGLPVVVLVGFAACCLLVCGGTSKARPGNYTCCHALVCAGDHRVIAILPPTVRMWHLKEDRRGIRRNDSSNAKQQHSICLPGLGTRDMASTVPGVDVPSTSGPELSGSRTGPTSLLSPWLWPIWPLLLCLGLAPFGGSTPPGPKAGQVTDH